MMRLPSRQSRRVGGVTCCGDRKKDIVQSVAYEYAQHSMRRCLGTCRKIERCQSSVCTERSYVARVICIKNAMAIMRNQKANTQLACVHQSLRLRAAKRPHLDAVPCTRTEPGVTSYYATRYALRIRASETDRTEEKNRLLSRDQQRQLGMSDFIVLFLLAQISVGILFVWFATRNTINIGHLISPDSRGFESPLRFHISARGKKTR